MKRLVLIRHAKSSWSDPSAADFDRKLNRRGKRDAPFMAEKLALRLGSPPDAVISSPAKRARKTARVMAKGVGFDRRRIWFLEELYHASTAGLLAVIHKVEDSIGCFFLVGHNYAITDLAEELTATSIGNIPTSGIVAMECDVSYWSDVAAGSGSLLFFDYPKRYPELQ